MEIFRTAQNPWGQDVWIGVGWDLMWAAIIVSALFVIGHAIWIRTRPAETHGADAGSAAGVPARIKRHSLASRVFHWTMALAMLVLLATAFVPVMGFQFAWIELHWMAGVVLTLTIVYHVVHALGRGRLWEMMQVNVAEGMAVLAHLRSADSPEPKAGKYPFDHRLFHHGIVVVGLGVIATGLLMMVRIDTPFLARNPYLLSDQLWGVVYVVHGLCGVALILMTASHIYFALRPEKLWITWSMVRGWIDREHYLAHFDPQKWAPEDAGSDALGGGEPSSGALVDASVSAPREGDA